MTKAQADRELLRLGITNEGTRDSLLSRALRAGSATTRTSAGSICVTCYGGSYDVTGG